jgi:hypothetical protein
VELRCRECEEITTAPGHFADYASCEHCGSEDLVDTSTWDEEDVQTREPRRRKVDPGVEGARTIAHELLLANGVESPPVDVEAIATKLGLTVVRLDLGDVSGELRGTRITVNSKHSRVRQRFSIGHEIGHHQLHTEHDARRDSAIERQAQAFAGALLVPPGLLRRQIEQTQGLGELARRFQVSRDAMHIALEGAGLLGRLETN